MMRWNILVQVMKNEVIQKMKNLLRRSGRPLQQIVRRLEEIDNANRLKGEMLVKNSSSNIAGQYKLEDIHYTGPILPQFVGGEQNKVLRFKNSVLSTSLGDNCVFLDNENDVFVIENFIKHHERVHVIGRRFMKKEDMYTYPLPSSSFNELLVSNLSRNLKIPVTIPNNGSFFTCPLVNHCLF